MQGVAGWFKGEAPEISASAPRMGIPARFPAVIWGPLSAGARRTEKLTSGVAASEAGGDARVGERTLREQVPGRAWRAGARAGPRAEERVRPRGGGKESGR